ncbi:hypothetical protein AQJ46_43350 [Streptomyces canus]|uniref:Uncharacterized protein n=1 Tax=Streptomyces canus TaxID=58343 RepID=A0A101RMA9_9ACTN|nr:hypothetical protein AQJ46_43350 [Streptomyces canus]
MRYAQGGELTADRRRWRERIRYWAGGWFARGERTAVIAKDLRVTERSVEGDGGVRLHRLRVHHSRTRLRFTALRSAEDP